MKKRNWKTKTFWGSVATLATGIGLCFAGDYAAGAQTICLGLLGITGRAAVLKVENKLHPDLPY